MNLNDFLKSILVKETYLDDILVTEDFIVDTFENLFDNVGLNSEIVNYWHQNNVGELSYKQGRYYYTISNIILNNDNCNYLGTNIKKLMELYKSK